MNHSPMNPWPMILADLRAMRWNALVTILLVAIAVAIGVAIGGQERALRQSSARAADDFPLLVAAPGSQTQLVLTAIYLEPEALPLLDGALLNRLARDERVAGVAPIAFGDRVHGYSVIGTNADWATRWGRLGLSEGRLFAARDEAVIGAEVRLNLGDSITPSHGLAAHHHGDDDDDEDEAEHKHEGVVLKIVGRLPPTGSPWDRAILVPVESVWHTHALGTGHQDETRIGAPYDAQPVPGVPAIVVKPKSIAAAYQLRAEYRRDGTMALFPAEVLVSLYQATGDLRDMLLIAAALNNVVVFLAILLLLVTLAGLRRRRYAVLRALGATKAYVALVVWLGAALLTLLGSLLGLLLGWAAALGVSALIQARTGLMLYPRPAAEEILLVLGMALLGSLLALVPALIALRQPAGEALRQP